MHGNLCVFMCGAQVCGIDEKKKIKLMASVSTMTSQR